MENTMKSEPPQTSPEIAKMPKRIEGGVPPDASTAPHCPFYPVTFVPYIGIGHDGKFGMIGWKCMWICERLLREWNRKVREDWYNMYVEPQCYYGEILFIRTVELTPDNCVSTLTSLQPKGDGET